MKKNESVGRLHNVNFSPFTTYLRPTSHSLTSLQLKNEKNLKNFIAISTHRKQPEKQGKENTPN